MSLKNIFSFVILSRIKSFLILTILFGVFFSWTNMASSSTTDSAAATPANGGSIVFENPITPKTLDEVGMAVLNNMQGYLGIIAVIVVIIGAIMYMLSAGDETKITRAKAIIGGALIGLSIILAAPSFLKEIKTILGGSSTGNYGDIGTALSLQQIALKILNFLLSIFGIISVIALIAGGVMYVTAYGDDERIESGKKIIKYALIGTVIGVGALAISKAIATFFVAK